MVINIVFIFADSNCKYIDMSEIRKLKITEMNRLTVEEFKERIQGGRQASSGSCT